MKRFCFVISMLIFGASSAFAQDNAQDKPTPPTQEELQKEVQAEKKRLEKIWKEKSDAIVAVGKAAEKEKKEKERARAARLTPEQAQERVKEIRTLIEREDLLVQKYGRALERSLHDADQALGGLFILRPVDPARHNPVWEQQTRMRLLLRFLEGRPHRHLDPKNPELVRFEDQKDSKFQARYADPLEDLKETPGKHLNLTEQGKSELHELFFEEDSGRPPFSMYRIEALAVGRLGEADFFRAQWIQGGFRDFLNETEIIDLKIRALTAELKNASFTYGDLFKEEFTGMLEDCDSCVRENQNSLAREKAEIDDQLRGLRAIEKALAEAEKAETPLSEERRVELQRQLKEVGKNRK